MFQSALQQPLVPAEGSTVDTGSASFVLAHACGVGIGASAGGLEVLERLFRAVPADTGMAYVVVQHLSPDFKSLMPELLERHTRMPVVAVDSDVPLNANTVYVLTSGLMLKGCRARVCMSSRGARRSSITCRSTCSSSRWPRWARGQSPSCCWAPARTA